MLRGSRFYRALQVLAALMTCLLMLPLPVSAAAPAAAPHPAVTVNFEIIAVKADQSVTVRTKDFPVRTKFVVLMDVVGNKAVDGIQAAEFDSGAGGAVEGTFPIPKELHGKVIIAIRLDSKDGYTANNWFFNHDMVKAVVDPNAKPEISFSNTLKNTSTQVTAKNLPAKALFRVRVGPYDSFYRDYVHVEPVTSSDTGTLDFTLHLPKAIQEKDAKNIMVRIDGGGVYTYRIYQNVDGGTVVNPGSLYKAYDCKVIDLNPIPQQDPRGDFDVIWTIQNTGTTEWDSRRVVFRWVGGDKMHKYEDIRFLPYDVKFGGVVQFAIDMRAPETAGWHSTSWALINRDNKTLCTVSVSMSVK